MQGKGSYTLNVQVERFRDSPVGFVVPISGFDPRCAETYEHWAFVPDPLPDEIALRPTTWSLVSEAMFSIGKLDQAGQQLPDPALLQQPTLRSEAQSTSALEGTYAPLIEVLGSDRGDPTRGSPELREVLRYVLAAEHAYAAIRDRPLTLQLLLELHALLVSDTPSDGPDTGKVRGHQVVIGAPSGRVGDARFVPSPPGQPLEAGLRAWIDWVNVAHPALPAAVAAALAHYQFEALHPFSDGNGRIGRLAIVLHLMRSGVLREPLLAVSPWFEARRAGYQDELQRVSETGGWDRWVRFFATGLRDQAEDTTRKIGELVGFQRRARELCRQHRLRGIALDVAENLVAWPVVTPTWVQRHHKVTYPAANGAVARLVDIGLLREITGSNYGRRFVADEVMRILER